MIAILRLIDMYYQMALCKPCASVSEFYHQGVKGSISAILSWTLHSRWDRTSIWIPNYSSSQNYSLALSVRWGNIPTVLHKLASANFPNLLLPVTLSTLNRLVSYCHSKSSTHAFLTPVPLLPHHMELPNYLPHWGFIWNEHFSINL